MRYQNYVFENIGQQILFETFNIYYYWEYKGFVAVDPGTEFRRNSY
jgi:hypothetical protein